MQPSMDRMVSYTISGTKGVNMGRKRKYRLDEDVELQGTIKQYNVLRDWWSIHYMAYLEKEKMRRMKQNKK